MMSQTSANVDANPPAYMEIHIKECANPELLDGWEHWTLEDIIRVVELMKEGKKNGNYYSTVAANVGQIAFNKLLKAADDQTIPFELIEKTVNVVAHENVTVINDSVFDYTGFAMGWQLVCDFLKAFIRHGKQDARYYDLVYMILTRQPRKDDSFPIGHCIKDCKGFKDGVLAEFPPEMQGQLKGESFYAEKGNVCYSLLTDASINM